MESLFRDLQKFMLFFELVAELFIQQRKNNPDDATNFLRFLLSSGCRLQLSWRFLTVIVRIAFSTGGSKPGTAITSCSWISTAIGRLANSTSMQIIYWRLCYYWSTMLPPSPFMLRLCRTNRYWFPSEQLKVMTNGMEFLQSLKWNISITYSGLRNPFPKHRFLDCHIFSLFNWRITAFICLLIDARFISRLSKMCPIILGYQITFPINSVISNNLY